MNFYRIRTMCPYCATEEENWLFNNKVFPKEDTTCCSCSGNYIAHQFISGLLEKEGPRTLSTANTRRN